MFFLDIFQQIIYQPFLNVLVGIYWLLGFASEGAPDMGIAVILLTVFIRILMLPMSLSATRSEEDRREIGIKVAELEKLYIADPIKLRMGKKKVFKKSRSVIISELFSLFVQVSIALMLWRIFETGLTGEDLHLIYAFMPEVSLPFNLVFLGEIDLSHGNLLLNFVQSFTIFLFETIAVLTSPYPPSKGEVVRLQLTLPIVSFLIFMYLPAGKKLFVITTLCFSIVLTLAQFIYRSFMSYKDKMEQKELAEESQDMPPEEKVVVAIKE
jgi:YidC/Oxa1 family membrane protein insertase